MTADPRPRSRCVITFYLIVGMILLVVSANRAKAQCQNGSCSIAPGSTLTLPYDSRLQLPVPAAPWYSPSQLVVNVPENIEQKPKTTVATGGYRFWARPDNPNVLSLWKDDIYIGDADPDKGTFKFAFEKSTLDLVTMLGKPRVFADKPKAGIKETSEIDPPREVTADKTPTPKPMAPPNAGIEEVDGPPSCPPGMDGCKKEVVRDVVDGEVKLQYRDNFGMNRDRDPYPKKGIHRFSISGREVGQAEGLASLRGDGSIPDDGGLYRLTVIGTPKAREKVMNDLKTHPGLKALEGKVIVSEYDPSDWEVKDSNFVLPKGSDDIQIYCQKPTGEVVWREKYEDGPDGLTKALRGPVPGYDPQKDPQPKPDVKPDSPSGPKLELNQTTLAWIAMIGVGIYIFLNRK